MKIALFRGTTERWEQESIERGILLSARAHRAETEQAHRDELPRPFSELTADEINAELVKRVGVETAKGAVNTYSHFVPLGTNRRISSGFGHGPCYVFFLDCVLINGQSAREIREALQQTEVVAELERGAVPIFAGGNSEYLAYTGTRITEPLLLKSGDQLPSKYQELLLSTLFPDQFKAA